MFGRGISLFRLFGFEVRLDWSWLIIAVLLTWSLARGVFPVHYIGLAPGTYWWMGVVGALGLFVSIVLHEFGHSLVARKFGIPMRGITLFIFGGVAEMGSEPRNARSEFFMAIAGPLVTVVLAGIFFGLSEWSQRVPWPLPLIGILAYLSWINIALLAFNLVPAFPLDGGRVLRSLLWAWKRDLRWATRIASAIGSGFAFLMIGWGIFRFLIGDFVGGIWSFLIGLFIRNASQMSYRQILLRETLSGEPVGRLMTPNPVTIQPADSVKTIVEDYLYKYPYKSYPVVQDGNLLGCVTIDQVKQIPRAEWSQRTAESVAAPCSSENMIEPQADAGKALSGMSNAHVSRLMVVDHGRLVGIIALRDFANYFSRKLEFEGA